MINIDPYKKVAFEAINKVNDVVLNYYHHLPPIETKPDNTPVTQADRQVEAIIIDLVKNHFPDHGFLGEELGETNPEAEFTWIIDPIDGTKNFIHHIDFFGTLLALRYQDQIVLGLSHLPAVKETLYASVAEKATLNGQPVHVSAVDSFANAYINFSPSQLKDSPGMAIFKKVIEQKVHALRGFGDCYGYHLVATGRSDVFFEMSTKIWDVAPFHIILPQAGGQHTDLTGNLHQLGGTSLATNSLLHQPMLDLIDSSIS